MRERATVLDERTAFRGRVFDVAVERVTLPHGVDTTLEVVRHRGSVVLIAQPDADSVYLVRQYRHPAGAFLWELPAGTLDDAEAPEAAARRECQEELGLVAGEVEYLGEFFASPGYCTEVMRYFRLTNLRRPAEGDRVSAPDADEMLEPRALSLDDLRGWIADGSLADMKTAAGLALLDSRRGRR